MTITTQYIGVNRPSNDYWTQSYNIWASANGPPRCPGDGIYVGNYPIAPNVSTVTVAWTPPDNQTYTYLAQPVRFDITGLASILPL